MINSECFVVRYFKKGNFVRKVYIFKSNFIRVFGNSCECLLNKSNDIIMGL